MFCSIKEAAAGHFREQCDPLIRFLLHCLSLWLNEQRSQGSGRQALTALGQLDQLDQEVPERPPRHFDYLRNPRNGPWTHGGAGGLTAESEGQSPAGCC